ncbi:MAG: LPS export ABC transporter periplasmic protein LptC [Terriglobia bacterium]
MGSQSLSQQTDTRRRRITGLVGVALGVTVLIIAGAYWRGRTRKDSGAPLPQALPKNVDQQLSGYTFTRSDEGRRIFTIHAARSMSFTHGGATVLQDVYVEVFGPAGNRRDVLRTEQCDYDPGTGQLFAGGKVEIELNDMGKVLPDAGPSALPRQDPVYLETSKVYFKQKGTLAETDQPVKFHTDRGSGTARGMTYDTRTGSLELQNDVVLNLPPRGGKRPLTAATLTASRLSFDKEKQIAEIRGPIEISQGSRHVSAGRGTIILEGRNRVKQAVFEDGVQGTDKTPPRAMGIGARSMRADFDPLNGQLRNLHAEGNVKGQVWRNNKVSRLAAQQLEIAFSGIHPRPLNGAASGNVKLSTDSFPGIESPSGPATKGNNFGGGNQTLTAAQVQFTFRPKQQTLKRAQTVGVGHLLLVPADAKTGNREIFANPLVMDFDAHSRLETLQGLSQTKIIFQPSKQAPPGSPPRESSSDRLKATFNPATEALGEVAQSGNFQFTEGDREGRADQGLYESRTQILTLTGRPQVSDPDTRVRADRIVVDLAKDSAEGLGHVQSTHLDITSQAPGHGKGIPTNVVADRMLAIRASQFVHYEGHVRAWHGQDVVESPALDVYKRERRVTSASKVLTSFIQPTSTDPKSGAATGASRKGPRPVTISADRLDYSDDGRKASYLGNVVLQTEETTLRADRLDVYFSAAATAGKSAESSQIDRAVAEGHVSVVQPTRHATSERAEYSATQGKILLTGGPPAVVDAVQGYTTGRRLTLFLHDDTIFVDGGEKSPTLSKHHISP